MDWQIISDAGAMCLAIGGLVPYLIPEIEQPVKNSIKLRVAILVGFLTFGVIVVVCNRVERNKLQSQLDDVPKKTAQIMKYQTLPSIVLTETPAPPPIVKSNRKPIIKATSNNDSLQLAKDADSVSTRLLQFIANKEPPTFAINSGETWNQSADRLLAYYRSLNSDYQVYFLQDVSRIHDRLKEKGLSDPDLDWLYDKPTNPIGMKMVASRLAVLADRLRRTMPQSTPGTQGSQNG